MEKINLTEKDRDTLYTIHQSDSVYEAWENGLTENDFDNGHLASLWADLDQTITDTQKLARDLYDYAIAAENREI